MLRILTLSALILTVLPCYAQDINGVWKGKLVMEPGGCFPVYNIEIQLQVAGTKITGVSYHFSDTSNFVKESFEGNFRPDSNNISISETGVTTFRVLGDCIPCIKKYFLSYHKGGTEEQLRGSWSGKTMDGKTACPPGTIVLQRFDKSSRSEE